MKYTLNILYSFLFFSLLWGALVYGQIGNPTQSSKWAYEAYTLKESRAKGINKQKIVIVSGSNSLFGIDSQMLEKQWGIPVVNDAVHAGLGIVYILHKSKLVLKKGDIVILPLEYNFYTMSQKPSQVYNDYILSRDPKYFFELPALEKLKTIYAIDFKRIKKGYSAYIKPLQETSGVYSSVNNINSYGDQINIEYSLMTTTQFNALNAIKADKVESTTISHEFKKHIDNYVAWSKINNISLIFMPPNHMFFNDYNSPEYKIFLENIKNFYLNRNISYEGKPEDHMLNKQYYFNTAYHLNNRGVERRTKQIIKDIDHRILSLIQH